MFKNTAIWYSEASLLTLTSHNVFETIFITYQMKNYLDIHIQVALNIAHLIVSIFILYLPIFLFVFVGFVIRICQDLYRGRRGPPASLAAHSSWPESSRHEHRLQMRFEQLSRSLNTLSSEHSFSKYFFSEHFFSLNTVSLNTLSLNTHSLNTLSLRKHLIWKHIQSQILPLTQKEERRSG